MAIHKIRVWEKEGFYDAVGQGILKDIRDLGIKEVSSVRFSFLYYLNAGLDASQLKRIAEDLLIDRIVQEYSINDSNPIGNSPQSHTVEVAYNPGVMDPSEESILKAIIDMGISGVKSVRSARQYMLKGQNLSEKTVKIISEKLLYNKAIQHIVAQGSIAAEGKEIQSGNYRFNLITIDLLNSSKKDLDRISKEGQLFLNTEEMFQIKGYFKEIGRPPTDCELETIAQTWSEHCVHKTFRGKIEYIEGVKGSRGQGVKGLRGKGAKGKIINNLLKSTIMKVTEELDKPWCVSVFKDNSGVIRFDDEYNVCFKVETHNHPSALEPFGGANTGVGGVIRDPMGTGLGARPVFNTDVFCFGPPDYPHNKLAKGLLHPKRIAKGVVSGVRDYGNKMGIPTVNGAVLFDEGYVGNPLVYCGTAGIMPKDKSFKKVNPGDLIVVAGGRTGRDGIHGATFSSGELTHESEELSAGAVQIGNPITEKKMLDTLMQARDKGLYCAITDCGAGGLSSAVGEMGEDLGAKVYLEKAPLKYQGLSYAQIWISEAQERMVLSVPPGNKDALLSLLAAEDVEATVIGEFTNTKHLELFYAANKVCDLDMEFLHKGLPDITKKAVWRQPKYKEPKIKCPQDLTLTLKKILGHYNVASKEWIIRQYDHEVQGGSVLKPLTGVCNDGPSDAAIVKPRLDSQRALIVSCGINFKFGLIDPYWMAASCIDEALRQIIAVGGSLEETALLDNFCWGSPDKPDRLAGLVRAAFGCYDAAKGFGVPFISGKDSLNNEYGVLIKDKNGKQKVESKAIPGTLLISAISVMHDITKAISMDAKEPGDLIYIIGNTYEELGASHYFDILGYTGNSLPRLNSKQAKLLMDKLSLASGKGLLRAMHDCSEGGLAVALAEMAFAGGFGMEVFLADVPYEAGQKTEDRGQDKRNDFVLFSESNSRFVAEVKKENQKEFEKTMAGLPFGLIGCVSKNNIFKVYGLNGKTCIEAAIEDLKDDWKKPLAW